MAKVNKRDLERLYRHLKENSADEVKEAVSRLARKAGYGVLRGAQDRVPVRDGVLRRSLSVGRPDNVFEFSMKGSHADITVGTNVEYARYVEEGFTQRKGQFVPGYWKGGEFRYDPNAYKKFLQERKKGNHPNLTDYGIILTGQRIPGVRYLARSLAEIEAVLDDLAYEELEDLARRLFPDG
jgi:hypothetical protein